MLKIQQLTKAHDRQGFDCGVEALNHFLHRTARQHIEKNLSNTSVLIDDLEPAKILGFYTLTFCEIEPTLLPASLSKGLPSNRLPGIKLARFAISAKAQGKGYGRALLLEAMRDSVDIAKKAGGIALFVDAKDESAAAFYRKYGFASWPNDELHLMMPMNHVEKAVACIANLPGS